MTQGLRPAVFGLPGPVDGDTVEQYAGRPLRSATDEAAYEQMLGQYAPLYRRFRAFARRRQPGAPVAVVASATRQVMKTAADRGVQSAIDWCVRFGE